MSALQFLSKKSWHTATIRNEEKVWLKEQEAAKEKARIEELQKQLEEERRLEEIHRLEIKSGRLNPSEVLKRRRLNWMYEHGPNNLDAKSPHPQDGTTLKPNDGPSADNNDGQAALPDSAQEGKESSAAFLARLEETMREDPLVEIERDKAMAQRAALNTRFATVDTSSRRRKTPKYSTEELEAKLLRKEYRRKVREERRLRREERAQRKREKSREDVDEDLKDGRRSLEEEPTGHSAAAVTNAEAVEKDDDLRQVQGERRLHSHKYGLKVPSGGTQVGVTTEFVPKLREEEGNPRARSTVAERSYRRPPANQTRVLTSEERQLRLKKMKEDALRLNEKRRKRVNDYVDAFGRGATDADSMPQQDAVASRDDATDDPASAFAKQTIARDSSAAGRIRQRRAWATNDSNAKY